MPRPALPRVLVPLLPPPRIPPHCRRRSNQWQREALLLAFARLASWPKRKKKMKISRFRARRLKKRNRLAMRTILWATWMMMMTTTTATKRLKRRRSPLQENLVVTATTHASLKRPILTTMMILCKRRKRTRIQRQNRSPCRLNNLNQSVDDDARNSFKRPLWMNQATFTLKPKKFGKKFRPTKKRRNPRQRRQHANQRWASRKSNRPRKRGARQKEV
mmetsp:Transcript_11490/g.31791  ORF Transcript_11490/g.31791 Transcript_11490/m.31791 type:complete len:218 (+) Transcript_11490:912-1565(+)